jgi:hypothetical protein
MASSGMLGRVAVIRTDVSEGLSASIITVLMVEAISPSEMSVLTRGHRAYYPRRRHSSKKGLLS